MSVLMAVQELTLVDRYRYDGLYLVVSVSVSLTFRIPLSHFCIG